MAQWRTLRCVALAPGWFGRLWRDPKGQKLILAGIAVAIVALLAISRTSSTGGSKPTNVSASPTAQPATGAVGASPYRLGSPQSTFTAALGAPTPDPNALTLTRYQQCADAPTPRWGVTVDQASGNVSFIDRETCPGDPTYTNASALAEAERFLPPDAVETQGPHPGTSWDVAGSTLVTFQSAEIVSELPDLRYVDCDSHDPEQPGTIDITLLGAKGWGIALAGCAPSS